MRFEFDGGLGAPNDIPAVANAFATAFVADIEAAPALKAELIRGRLGRSGLARIVTRDLDRARLGVPGPALFPNIRAVAKEFLAQEARHVSGAHLEGGLGQWDAIFGAIGAAAGAASGIYAAKTNADMTKQLANLQLQKQKTDLQIAQMQASQSQLSLASANMAITGAVQSIGGWPVVFTGAIALAVGGYFLLRNR